mmetsp:Transcript_14956/g.36605  ORF Transcript_14956/g.36605 Transcript_14956/m.36605 type:complete len:425 (-) Transcript_14956:222-1496(-)
MEGGEEEEEGEDDCVRDGGHIGYVGRSRNKRQARPQALVLPLRNGGGANGNNAYSPHDGLAAPIERVGTRRGTASYGLALMAASALVSAVTSLLIKLIANKGVSTFEIIFYQRLFQWICNFTCLIIYGIPFYTWWGTSTQHRMWLCFRGFFGFLALACGYWSVAHLSLSDAVTIRSFTPVVCGVLSKILLKEKWPCIEISASFTAMLGVWLALRCPSSTQVSCYRGIDMLIALCAPTFAGAAFVALRKADQVQKTHPLVIVNFFAMFTVLLSLPIDVWVGRWGALPWRRGCENDLHDDLVGTLTARDFGIQDWLLVAFISLSAFTSQFLLTVGLQLERAAPASVVTLIGIPATFTLQHIFVKCEPVTLQSLLGGTILTASIATVGLNKFFNKESKEKVQPLLRPAPPSPWERIKAGFSYTGFSR